VNLAGDVIVCINPHQYDHPVALGLDVVAGG
jgi:hypothetical protein